MKKAFTLLLVMAMLVAALLPMSVQAATELKNLTITMELPDPGKAPTTTATCGTGYSIHAIDWLDRETNKFLEPGDKIQGGHKYYAYLWVEANDGYKFASIDDKTPNVNVTVNGAACTATKAFEYTAPAMVYVAYPITIPSRWIRSVDLTIPEPVYGNKPTYPIIETGTYKYTTMIDLPDVINGIHWTDMTTEQYMDPDNTFRYGVPYQFAISLQPKTGYAFAPYAEARVNGRVASASIDYGTVLFVKFTFPALEDTHTHSYMDWAWNSGQHYKNCTDCDEIFFLESHKGGVATCQSNGKCTVCGFEYILSGEEYHVPDISKWVARGDQYHYHPCKLCGAHCDAQDHVAGPAGTPDAAVVCKDCGYIMTPAKDHKHNLTKVPKKDATCTESGNVEYYTCDGCSDFFADSEGKTKISETGIAPLGHKLSDDWMYDENNHWRICIVCGEVLAETQMTHQMENEKCTTCSYDGTVSDTRPGTEPTDTAPVPTDPQSPDQGSDGMPCWVLLLIGLSAVAVGVGGGALILTKKKKE